MSVRWIGELGSANEIPAVIDLLNAGKEASDMSAAEQALTVLCEKSANADASVVKLTAAMAKAQPPQKSVMVRVLGSVSGPAALKAVRTSVDDANIGVRATAIRVLGSWKTADAAPELLALAKTAKAAEEKVLLVRGFLTLAANTDIPEAQRTTMCFEGAKLAGSKEEKRLLLAAMGTVHTVRSLVQIRPYLNDSATVEEASAATVAVAAKLVEGDGAAQTVEPLEKVAQSVSNANLVQQAKKLLDQAKKKAAK
jgi:hypothetical protein